MSKTLGDVFETRALEYLQRQRMKLVARNVRCRDGEIDLVMLDERGALVFVEARAAGARRAALPDDVARRMPVCRFDVVTFVPAVSVGSPMHFVPTDHEHGRAHDAYGKACGKLCGFQRTHLAARRGR